MTLFLFYRKSKYAHHGFNFRVPFEGEVVRNDGGLKQMEVLK